MNMDPQAGPFHRRETHHDGPHDHAGGADDGHHHGHSHHPARFGMAFAVGISLNTLFVLLEAGFGVWSNSVALVADAGHNLSDVLGLAIAWIAAELSKRPPSGRYTYGLRGSSILAALFNAVFLLVAVGAIGWEAILRLFDPQPLGGATVMVVAAIGIAVNGVTAYLFASGRKGDLNIRGAYLHMLADAGVSAGVVLAGLVILLTGWTWLDPVASLVIVAVIVWGTWGLLRDSLALSLDAVPAGIDPQAVRSLLTRQPGVTALHDLHIWAMSTTENALTAHLIMPGGHPGDEFLVRVCDALRRDFGIGHATLQVETDQHIACALASDAVV